MSFPEIDPEEKKVLAFRFHNGLPSGVTLQGTPTVEVTATTDPDPTSKFSSPQVDGAKVLIAAHDCLEGDVYHIRVIAPTSDPENVLVIGADLPCVKF
jgi:hypothetical protein